MPEVQKYLSRHRGQDQWKIFRHESGLKEAFADRLDRLIYLSPESPNVLDVIEEDKIYVIGGISDNQNDMKGDCGCVPKFLSV